MKNDRIGEHLLAKNGQHMKIIAYRNSMDIDIQFEDGTIVTNKTYQSFKKGAIKNPKIKKNVIKKNDKIGEINTANNGQKMKIIEYFGADNITVEFEDKTIVKNKTYHAFKIGSIKNPNVISCSTLSKRKANEREGTTNKSSCGLNMTIIKYRSAKDMDIQFEDGTIVEHVWYNRFKTGNIKHHLAGKDGLRLGAKKENKDGRKMEVIRYNGARDIDVKFEDGTIIKNTTYKTFKEGNIKHPLDKGPCHIGESVKAINGQMMTLIDWQSNRDITVKFEDNTIVKTNYRYFREGRVGNPNYTISDRCRQNKLGETSTSTNGQTITLIEYRRSNDIDVKFEDGTIVKNTHYSAFKNGTIHNPKLPIIKKKYNTSRNSRIGESIIAKNGMKMTIINYRKYSDIDVIFEDNTIVEHKSYNDFKTGYIKNPNIRHIIKN